MRSCPTSSAAWTLDRSISDPLADRGEGSRSGQDCRRGQRQYRSERVSDPASIAWIGNLS